MVGLNFKEKSSYNFNDLVEIVKILRSPEGCPWDREQTHKSIRSNFIEETYEAIEAIDTDDMELLKEELGDVLLQVALHSEIESEIGTFNIDDVCDG
ncbi:MAG: MazG nucleotide pyrophosphohydrolase domain-containing protein, partial [Ruminococcus sp.]|nr:MazG nucleotide pyrophosphohydrolase domain-containing protein [Ruminococcus sp.]